MSEGQHHHHSKEILLAKTYTGEAPSYVIHTVYIVAKGNEKALTDFLNSNFVETPPKGVIECRLASLKATGPNGTSKLSLIVYWNSGVDATSANQQAHKLNHDIQKLFGGVKPRSNGGFVQWNGQTPLGLKVSLRSSPVQVTVVPSFWKQVGKFFTVNPLLALESLTLKKLSMARQVSAETFNDLINSHLNLDLDVNLATPKVIVPINPSRTDSTVALLDLGLFRAESLQKIESGRKLDGLYESITATLANASLVFLPSKKALEQQSEALASHRGSVVFRVL